MAASSDADEDRMVQMRARVDLHATLSRRQQIQEAHEILQAIEAQHPASVTVENNGAIN